MKQQLLDILKGLKKIEAAEYLVLVILVTVSVWDWSIAVKLFFLLVAVVAVHIISTKHLGNPALTKPMRWALLLMAGFYLWQGVTLLWVDDLPSGWNFMLKRLPLLLLPVMLLCNDTSYITHPRRRGILYALTASLLVKFFYCLIKTLASGKGFHLDIFTNDTHHTYLSLYLLVVLGFLYSEWVNHRETMHRYHKIAIPCIAAVITTYIVLSTSRTGIAGIAIIFVCIVLHQMVRLHNTKVGITIIIGGLALGCATYFILPEKSRRITETVITIHRGDKNDVREDIYSNAFHASIDNMPFGTGIGDGQATLASYYEKEGLEWPDLNTHNIYFDTLLSLGLPGLLLLLAMFTLPAVDGYRRRDFELVTLIVMTAFCGLFESIISRQMGLMFIVPMWYAIASCVPCPQTGSTDSQ